MKYTRKNLYSAMDNKNQDTLISVAIITYNQEKYIRQTIDSVLMQEVEAIVEIVIGEDCSTDSTRAILEEYAAWHPQKFKLLLREKNMGPVANWIDVMFNCQGKYIAILEGDDYWTDPLKLQKQFRLFEQDISVSGIYHAAKIINENGEQIGASPINGKDYLSVESFLNAKYSIPSLSVMFRNFYKSGNPDKIKEAYSGLFWVGDYLNDIMIISHGQYLFLDEIMGTYRKISAGGQSFTSQSLDTRLREGIKVRENADAFLNYKYHDLFIERIGEYCKPKHFQRFLSELISLSRFDADQLQSILKKIEFKLVSCIMPTCNRRRFVPQAIQYFLRQDYPNKELIILDDGSEPVHDLVPKADNIRYYRLEQKTTLGAKLNLACQYANGSIIANWDDHDWYAPWRLSYQVEALHQPGIEVCGINQLLYYDLEKKRGFLYQYANQKWPWLLGSSLCFTKSLWMHNKFAEISFGMDGLFMRATPPDRIKVLTDFQFLIHTIPLYNNSTKDTGDSWLHPHPVEALQKIMGADWQYYTNGTLPRTLENSKMLQKVSPQIRDKPVKILKNVFACLVHEQEDCILDMVRNLHYQDPASTILLYNGSEDPHLLENKSLFEPFNVVFYPNPKPQKHGYLHGFALDCMEYALENISFDTFTNVDSDQLCVRSGYSQYLSDFFSNDPYVGMLSKASELVTPEQQSNSTILRALKDYELWKPLLDSFPDGHSKFVHWTFWPSTVISYAAARDLVSLFYENKLLQEIMRKTKIWATEEIIFPTLIRLLGYEIAENPCSYAFVQSKKVFTLQEMAVAMDTKNVFWVHPVDRQYNDVLREFIRNRFNDYEK